MLKVCVLAACLALARAEVEERSVAADVASSSMVSGAYARSGDVAGAERARTKVE